MRIPHNSTFLFYLAAVTLWAGALPAKDFSFGGFLSAGYLESSRYNYLANTEEGDFDFAEIGLNASWNFAERATLNGQVFAFELGRYGNFDPQIDYLFVDYNFCHEFGVRAGRIKREFGLYNHVQDIDVTRPTILLPLGIYDQRYRDFSASLDGISVYGTIESPWGYVDYTAYAGEYHLSKDGGIAGYAQTQLTLIADDPSVDSIESGKNYGAQVWLNTKLEGLRLGMAVQSFPGLTIESSGILRGTGNPFLDGRRAQLLTDEIDYGFLQASAEYYVGEWTFTSEYVLSRASYLQSMRLQDIPLDSFEAEFESDAWFGSAARRFGRWEGAVCYTEFYNDRDSRNHGPNGLPDNGYNHDLQVSLRYDATDFWTLKLERHSISGTNRLFNQFGQNPALDERKWVLWAAKSTFSF